jgi:hypothetical protein
LQKLLPYSEERAAVTGMLFAYVDASQNVLKAQEDYRSIMKSHLKITFFDGFPEPFLKGVEDGIEVFCDCGSVDPSYLLGYRL